MDSVERLRELSVSEKFVESVGKRISEVRMGLLMLDDSCLLGRCYRYNTHYEAHGRLVRLTLRLAGTAISRACNGYRDMGSTLQAGDAGNRLFTVRLCSAVTPDSRMRLGERQIRKACSIVVERG